MPLSIATAVALLGCSSSEDPEAGQPASLTILMEDISYTDNIRSMLPEFEEATGISVTLETVPYSDMSARILQEFSQQSDYFDAVFTDSVYGSGYFESGYVEDLQPFAEADSEFGSLDEYYEPYMRPLTMPGGEVYGVPVYGESTWLMYRTDLFDEFGLEVPQTTDDLEQAARTISEGTNGEVAGITLRGAPGIQSVYPWAGILRAFGGDWYDGDRVAVDSPASIEAAEYWAELLRNYGASGAANFDWEQNRIAFTQGQAAMTIDATANGPFNEDEESSTIAGNVGYAPVPYAPGVTPADGNTSNSLNVHAMYMSTFSNNKEATWKFLSWATGEEVQANAVDTIESVGVTNTAVLEGDAYAEKYGAFQEAVMSQLETGNPNYLPSGQNANLIISETGQALSTILSGQQSAEDAMTTAAESINSRLVS